MTQEEAQLMNWQIAKTWYIDTGLDWNGVSLGAALEYEMLNVVGRIFRQQREETAPPESNQEATA